MNTADTVTSIESQNLSDYPDVLKVKDIKNILRIGINKAYDLVYEEIPHRKFGRAIRINKRVFIDWFNK